MGSSLTDFIQDNRAAIFEQWVDEMKDVQSDRADKVIADNVYNNISTEFIELILSNTFQMNASFVSKLEDVIDRIVRLGWPLTYLISGINKLERIIFDKYVAQDNESSYLKKDLFYEFDEWLTPVSHEIIEIYSRSLESTIGLQKMALQELSAPLIPVFDKITVMPLIGTIDTERAKQIMENLLQGVVKHRSEVVLIDITGVPVVDTMVAHHIIQASEAVRLVGTKCLLVGIRPEIAQTIVNLGISLNQLVTKNSLKKGIETALEMTNRQIIEVEELQ
ncbi:STAS domain-containing protein [Priestia koreensis]|uniref:STAS domain-containing protein n=1 Tax=Priestia koreensis TaxID=284581 RepID=UPI001F56DEF5|nr:STAS domain-containing protein [Priestia koreensis]MCM3006670.1 STAS domain-containing protein [Priestia koreensis]UNL85212.1 STAS domain-containing protein [Priestia koreensis]